jgi:hypothetical protein
MDKKRELVETGTHFDKLVAAFDEHRALYF